jgi:hypothetical protein
MDGILLNPLTLRQFERFTANPHHAVQIVGPHGIGKLTVSMLLASKLLEISREKLINYPYFLHVQPLKQTTSIDVVRETHRFLQRKTTGQSSIRRIILLENAHTLTTEAQNAFLKSLEEPPADTIIILTVAEPRQLLATISSRLQTLTIRLPTYKETAALYGDRAGFDQAYRLSNGLPGLLSELLDDREHPLLAAVERAKKLLQAPLFTRLASVDGLAAQRDDLPYLFMSMKRIAQTGLEQASKQQPAALLRWQRILEATYAAELALAQNANIKLTLTNFMLAC